MFQGFLFINECTNYFAYIKNLFYLKGSGTECAP